MRILHIASFLGNIGDNFNHLGTRSLLEDEIGDIKWTTLEIRETFRGLYSFNDEFANHCNTFDAVIFGGGNFFELWVDRSVNNTSVDIPFEVLAKIHVPFYFFALGVDPGMGVSERGIQKFSDWVRFVNKQSNLHLSVRNDGAYSTLSSLFDRTVADSFKRLLDGGFLVKSDQFNLVEHQPDVKFIGINIAGDMLDIRFNDEMRYEEFILEFARLLEDFLIENTVYQVILLPHIFRDLRVISDLLELLDDKIRRERIRISPLEQDNTGMLRLVEEYNKCEIILGNRFHSNVIGLILEKDLFGMYNYRQIKYLFDELGLQNYYDIRTKNGLSALFTALANHINEPLKNLGVSREFLDRGRLDALEFFRGLTN